MKKILIALLILLIPKNVYSISARNFVALDMDTNRVLLEKNMNDKHLIASITKILTAIIAIENGNLDEEVEVDDTILKAYGSSIYIEMGEKIKLEDLIYGLMLRSGNDAAVLIAKHIGGTLENFVQMMNSYAKKIGMQNSVFTNPHGLDEENENISTAYDMAILTSFAMKNEEYQKIVSTNKYTCKSDKKTYTWENKNKLLKEYKYTTGGKTGFTKKARRTLVSTASKDNKNITIVTLNDPDDWNTHKNTYDQIFNNYENKLIVKKENFKVDNEDFYKENKLYIKNDVYLTIKKEENKDITLNIILDKISKFKDNDKVGIMEVKLKDQVLKTENIYVSKKIINKHKPSIFKKIIGWFK